MSMTRTSNISRTVSSALFSNKYLRDNKGLEGESEPRLLNNH
jgi:hypothetical protein